MSTPDSPLEPVAVLFAEVIGASRYAAWDLHAKDFAWPEFKNFQPDIAERIYLEDGRNDADALMPYVEQMVNAVHADAAATALRACADSLYAHDLIGDTAVAAMRDAADGYQPEGDQ